MRGRRWIVVAAAALSVAACSSSSSTGASTPPASSAVVLLPLTSTCPEVQAALDRYLTVDPKDWAGLGAEASRISSTAVEADRSLFDALAATSNRMATTTDEATDQGPWLAVMDQLTSACKGAGAPLS